MKIGTVLELENDIKIGTGSAVGEIHHDDYCSGRG